MTYSLKFEITGYVSWLYLPVHSGSLKRIDYPKQLSGPPSIFGISLLLLKQLIIICLLVVTKAGVVPCDIPKKRPRISSIVQFIFHFWSFEISRNILRIQKTLTV